MFEWAWAKTHRYRAHDELHEMMPSFRRVDVAKWRKWRFYPGAITLLIPRMICSILAGAIIVLEINICLLCHDKSKPLTNPCRKWCLYWVYNIGARVLAYLICFAHFTSCEIISEEDVNYYEEWLGTKEEQAAEQLEEEPDAEQASRARRVPKRGPGRCSTVICNHIGYLEILNLVSSPLQPGFLS